MYTRNVNHLKSKDNLKKIKTAPSTQSSFRLTCINQTLARVLSKE